MSPLDRAVALLILLVWVPAARADSLCDLYRKNQPDLYKLICDGGRGSARPAGANSTFAAAFNLNSASLPTEPSSYGLESLLHSIRVGRTNAKLFSPTFSIVKGFKKFGTGISTGSNATFYGDDILQRLSGQPELQTFEPVENETGSLPNLNIGTAIGLFDFHGGSFRLGISARYNKITDTWGGGPALVLNWGRFTLGAGYTRERVSHQLPRLTFVSTQASVKLWIFEFEYDRLADDSSFGLKPIQIFTTTLTLKRLLLTAAIRRLDYYQYGTVNQSHYALQYLFSTHFSAGFLFNYIPGANSLGLQYYL